MPIDFWTQEIVGVSVDDQRGLPYLRGLAAQVGTPFSGGKQARDGTDGSTCSFQTVRMYEETNEAREEASFHLPDEGTHDDPRKSRGGVRQTGSHAFSTRRF